MGFKELPSGLFVPDGPGRNLKEGPGMGWGIPELPKRRTFIGPGEAPNPDTRGWNEADVHQHIQGRADATAAMLLGVALLKKLNLVWGHQHVAYTKAIWQDWGGNEENERAHRIPCNPTIAHHNIPDIPKSHRLRDALIRPLAKTDFLALVVNYVDSRFEDFGARDAVAAAVRFVVKEQGEGKPVSRDVLHYAATNIAKTGYENACTAVETYIQRKLDQEDVVGMMKRNDKFKNQPLAPLGNLETIQEVVYDFSSYTARCESKLLGTAPLEAEAKRLEALAKQD